MPPTDCLHSLTIDFEHAPPDVRAAFELSPEELTDLLCQAGRAGAPLLLLATGASLHLVSTSHCHFRAFRPVLARIRERAGKTDGWRGLPTRCRSRFTRIGRLCAD